jgi:hypothetical protein
MAEDADGNDAGRSWSDFCSLCDRRRGHDANRHEFRSLKNPSKWLLNVLHNKLKIIISTYI